MSQWKHPASVLMNAQISSANLKDVNFVFSICIIYYLTAKIEMLFRYRSKES